MTMSNGSFLALVILAASFLAVSHSALIGNIGNDEKQPQDNDWDYLLFVQRWPPSVCADTARAANGNGEQCVIPSDLSTQDWVMHGIWPTKAGTVGPVNCIPNFPWNFTNVKPLVNSLDVFWPNLEANTPVDSFWKHEYVKHGSCAANFPPLMGEDKFFSVPLNLRTKFQLFQALASKNIVPDDSKMYSYDDIIAGLQSVYGQRPEIWCAFDHTSKAHLIEEIRFCLDKNFNMFNCPTDDLPQQRAVPGTTKCPKGYRLGYPPLPSKKPQSKVDFAGRKKHHSKKKGSLRLVTQL